MNRLFENYLKNNPHPYKEKEEPTKDKKKTKEIIDEMYKDDHLDQYEDKTK